MLGRCVSSSAVAPWASINWRSRLIRVGVFVGIKNCEETEVSSQVTRYCTLRSLARQNSRSHEEHQLLGRDAYRSVLEEIADQRHVAKQRHLVDGSVLVGDDHATDDHSAAIRDDHLGLRRLRVQSRFALHAD